MEQLPRAIGQSPSVQRLVQRLPVHPPGQHPLSNAEGEPRQNPCLLQSPIPWGLGSALVQNPSVKQLPPRGSWSSNLVLTAVDTQASPEPGRH